MNQSNKALRGEVAEKINELRIIPSNEAVKQGAMDWPEICDYYAAQILALVTNHIKEALPEKKKVDSYKDASKRGELNWYYADVAYNQALDEVHQLLKEIEGAE